MRRYLVVLRQNETYRLEEGVSDFASFNPNTELLNHEHPKNEHFRKQIESIRGTSLSSSDTLVISNIRIFEFFPAFFEIVFATIIEDDDLTLREDRRQIVEDIVQHLKKRYSSRS